MKLDAELMFECLIYLNSYYFPVFSITQSIMWLAKDQSSLKATPASGRDAGVLSVCLFCELVKILLYTKYKEEKRDLITGIVVLFTLGTITASMYTFFIQDPVIKLEYILYSLMVMLALTEVVFGSLAFLHCCQNIPY